MSAALSSVVDSFSGSRVVVLGDAMLDVYLSGSSERLCQEAPVPVVAVDRRSDVPGGAANAAVNIAALGGRAELVAVVGRDAEGELLRRGLEQRGVASDGVIEDSSRTTLAKQRVLSGSQLVVRFDRGSAGALAPSTQALVVDRLRDLWADCDAVLVSDYGYGLVGPRVRAALGELQGRDARVLVVDAKDLGSYRDMGVTLVKPNFRQAAAMLGLEEHAAGDRAEAVTRAGEALLDATGAQIAAVTLDGEGAVILERGRPAYRTFARPSSDTRAAGAGDTFASALTLALASGSHTPGAAELASAAAALVVAQETTAACSASELRESLSAATKYVGEDRLAERARLYHAQRRRIVFTNGCFDILHRGHITSLNRAKTFGDVLVVAINSDASVARLKGPSRPINDLDDRVEVLTALSCVDHIVAFDDDTPARLIQRLRPDVFVKGGDYSVDMLPEARVVRSYGGEVRILSYVEDRSTTGIIERIHRLAQEPSRGAAS